MNKDEKTVAIGPRHVGVIKTDINHTILRILGAYKGGRGIPCMRKVLYKEYWFYYITTLIVFITLYIGCDFKSECISIGG